MLIAAGWLVADVLELLFKVDGGKDDEMCW